jgi:D-threo-aldose 1-dehydrogenase
METRPLGKSAINVPPIIFGTSCLGNLYKALPWETKLAILREIFTNMDRPVLDSAGKYGAGLALEVIGNGLRELGIPEERVQISNKLGWYRIPLTTPEPTFEPGAWVDLENDAVQKIGYNGILQCWEQGCELLGDCMPQLLSVHDPDEYLAAATSRSAKIKAFNDVTDAYRALMELKEQGFTQAIGVGAKKWQVIRDICKEIDLDWVMLAVSYTILKPPSELLDFIDELTDKGISVINSAVFHAGFLTGGKFFDYRVLDPYKEEDKFYFAWRDKFFALCQQFEVVPATACVQFAMSHPSIVCIALNTSNPKRVTQNIASVTVHISNDFWLAMKDAGLIDKKYPYVGL